MPKFRSLLVRYLASLLSLAIPACVALALRGRPDLAPIVSISFIVAISVSAWFAGFVGGLLVIAACFPLLSQIVSHGKLWFPPTIDWAALLVLVFIAAASDRVAKSRRRVEQILRSANEELEIKVRERTADLESARAQAEKQRVHLHSVFQQAPVAIDLLSGPDLIFEVVHPLTRERLGVDPAGRSLRDAAPALFQTLEEPLRNAYASGATETRREVAIARHAPNPDSNPGSVAGPNPSANGEEILLNVMLTPYRAPDGAAAGLIMLLQDVTAEVRSRRTVEAAEERLRETAKLESLGVLAGGIAHDFNNLLVGIMGNSSLALDILGPQSSVRHLLNGVLSASEKAASLTRQMLAYSGRGNFIIEKVDLSILTAEILPLITSSIHRSITIQTRFQADLPAVEGDRSQLQQIVMNLILNAAEACGTGPGRVNVSTNSRRLEQPLHQPFGLPPIPPGNYVVFQVRDTGCGMDAATQARIFDPFFTTKFTGRGLGLSAVLGIVRAHRGAISIDSTPGRGTNFDILFPASPAPVRTSRDSLSTPDAVGGTGVILVVDDETIVRQLARATLTRCGYEVLVAEDGHAAVDLFSREAHRVSAVVLDLTMPDMSGDEALARLREIHPRVKVIVSSGFSQSEAVERFRGHALAGFLQKPYKSRELASLVKETLAAETA
jgi:signal transduction histidine kinase/CheY-like chemotaxis protein